MLRMRRLMTPRRHRKEGEVVWRQKEGKLKNLSSAQRTSPLVERLQPRHAGIVPDADPVSLWVSIRTVQAAASADILNLRSNPDAEIRAGAGD